MNERPPECSRKIPCHVNGRFFVDNILSRRARIALFFFQALDATGDLALKLQAIPRHPTVADAEAGAPGVEKVEASFSVTVGFVSRIPYRFFTVGVYPKGGNI